MSTSTRKKLKTARVEARTTPESLALMKRAAELQGQSVSDFLVSAGANAARKIIAQTEIITLNHEASMQIAELLTHPPEPPEALKKAVENHKRLIVS